MKKIFEKTKGITLVITIIILLILSSIETTSDIKAKIIAYFTAQDGWKADTNNINNGYPIFSWQ